MQGVVSGGAERCFWGCRVGWPEMTSMSGFHGKTSVGMGLGLTKAILDPSSFERFDAFEKIMKNPEGDKVL